MLYVWMGLCAVHFPRMVECREEEEQRGDFRMYVVYGGIVIVKTKTSLSEAYLSFTPPRREAHEFVRICFQTDTSRRSCHRHTSKASSLMDAASIWHETQRSSDGTSLSQMNTLYDAIGKRPADDTRWDWTAQQRSRVSTSILPWNSLQAIVVLVERGVHEEGAPQVSGAETMSCILQLSPLPIRMTRRATHTDCNFENEGFKPPPSKRDTLKHQTQELSAGKALQRSTTLYPRHEAARVDSRHLAHALVAAFWAFRSGGFLAGGLLAACGLPLVALLVFACRCGSLGLSRALPSRGWPKERPNVHCRG